MSDPYAASGDWSSARPSDDDSWGPSTAVYGAGAKARRGAAEDDRSARGASSDHYPERYGDSYAEPRAAANGHSARPDGWSAAEVSHARPRLGRAPAGRAETAPVAGAYASARPHERGLPWWGALLVLIAIAVIGGLFDTVGAIQVNGGFNVGIVVASVVAIIVVKRSHMFPIVIAPPIVYSVGAVFDLYVSSNGLDDHKKVLDAATNYLVYGFPAIASATAAVLIVAGIRLIARK